MRMSCHRVGLAFLTVKHLRISPLLKCANVMPRKRLVATVTQS